MKDAAASRSEIADEALMVRFQGGDRSAFTLLVRRHQSPLYNFVLRQLRSASAAEEVVQDAFVRVVHNAAEFKHASRFSTWLYTIARNLCIDHVRKRALRNHPSLDEPKRTQHDAAGEGPTLGDRTADTRANVERTAVAAEIRERLLAAVDELPGRAARGLPPARGLERALQGDCRDRGSAGEHREEPDAVCARAPAGRPERFRGVRARLALSGAD